MWSFIFMWSTLAFSGSLVSGDPLNPAEWHKPSVACMRTNITHGKIKTYDCYGSAVISVLDSHKEIPCEELSLVTVYGPFKIDFKHCQIFAIGKPLCHPGKEPSLFGIEQCLAKSDTGFYIVLVLFVIMTLINFIICRIFFIRIKYVPSGYIGLYRFGGKLNFTLVAKKKENIGVKFHSKEEKALMTSKTYYRERFNFNWKQVIIIALYLTPSSLIPVAETKNITAGNHLLRDARNLHSHVIRASEGDTVSFGGNVIKITEAYYALEWVSAYRTCEFDTTLVADWHCTSVCDQNGKHCADIGPFGQWSKNISHYVDKNPNEPVYQVDYCMPGTTGCFIANGCWKWGINFNLHRRTEVEVMSVVGYTPYLKYILMNENENTPWAIRMATVSNWNHQCLIKMHSGTYMMCNQCSFLSYPEAGKIGELQLGGDNSISISRELSACQKDEYDGPVCKVSKSSLGTHMSNCDVIIPGVYFKNYTFHEGLVKYRKSLSVWIDFLTPDVEYKRENSDQCGGLKLSVWALEHSGTTAKLIAIPNKIVEGEFSQSSLPCTLGIMLIPCDGKGLMIDVNWPNDCLSDQKNIEMKVTDSRIIDYQDSTMLHYDSKSSTWGLDFSGFLGFFNHPSIFSLFGINIIIVVVAGFILLRR